MPSLVEEGTYTSEVYRAGIEGIPRGQWDAAAALNFNRWQTFRNIIVLQAIPPVVPAFGNYIVSMFKDTPLLSAITVLEVLQQAKLIGAQTFRYIEPLTLVGAQFLGAESDFGRRYSCGRTEIGAEQRVRDVAYAVGCTPRTIATIKKNAVRTAHPVVQT